MKGLTPARNDAPPSAANKGARIPSFLRDPRVRLRLEAGVSIGLAVGLFVYILSVLNVFSGLETLTTDFLYQPFPASGNVVIIAIDKKSLDEIGPWPWPRAIQAALLDRLSSSTPRVIAFDLVFPQPVPEDSAFASAIQRSGTVILAGVGVPAAEYPPTENSFPQFDVVALPAEGLRDAATAVGHQTIVPDPDGIVRRVPLAIDSNDTRYPAVGLVSASTFRNAKQIIYDLPARTVHVGETSIPTDQYGNALIAFTRPHEGLPTYSYSDVLRGQVPAQAFASKIVLIGGVATSESENYATPLTKGEERTYNVNIQADLANMLVSAPPFTLRELGGARQILLLFLAALLAGLTLPHIRPLYSAAVTLVYLLLLLLGAFEAFSRGVIVQFFYPALALIGTFALIALFRYLWEERQRQFLSLLFRRYLTADSVGRVVDAIDRGELPLTGTRREVTVLYADLRGFAAISEGLGAAIVLEIVNRYLELAFRAIQAEEGTINKPMGDALVAIWNAPLDQEDHATRAVRAAVEIRRSIQRFHGARDNEEQLNYGIGLATGTAVLGNINALGKVEYTLVGETVNIAARISAFANNNQVLADAVTAKGAPEGVEVRELNPVRVRGRKEPLPIWEIREPAGSPEKKAEEAEE